MPSIIRAANGWSIMNRLIRGACAVSLAGALVMAGTAHAAGEASRERIRERIGTLNAAIKVEAINPTPIEGLYEVRTSSGIGYVTGDGRYLLRGELLDLEQKRNLTWERVRDTDSVAEAISALDEDELIVYEPTAEQQHEVTVFTDIDCPYCRRFHRRLDDYLERGIRIRYAFLPRGGPGSTAFDKAVAVWCADDPHRAMTRAKNGESLPSADCSNPVAEQHRLARELGIRGTPTMVTTDGRRISGYVPPDELASRLDGD